MKHIEKLSYKYINTYGRFSQHRKSEEPIIDKINEIIDILQNKGLCKLKDKNVSQLLEIVKLNKEIDRLNNIINKLEWKPIEQYERPKYDWVLVKYFIEPNFECIPCVAENRFGKWYDRNDNLINGEIRYFFDMQQLDKLKALRENNK